MDTDKTSRKATFSKGKLVLIINQIYPSCHLNTKTAYERRREVK